MQITMARKNGQPSKATAYPSDPKTAVQGEVPLVYGGDTQHDRRYAKNQ